MGLLSKMLNLGQARELTKLANAVANIKNLLDSYERDPDDSFLLVSAWICKVGVLDMIVKNQWLPNYTVFVPMNGRQTRMTMAEVQMHTLYRLMNKVSLLNDSQLENSIREIMDGGEAFWEMDRNIPDEIRKVIENA